MCVCVWWRGAPLSFSPPEKGENAGGNNAAEIFVLFLGIVGADRPSDTAGLGALFPSILVGGSEMDKRRKTRKEEPGEEDGFGVIEMTRGSNGVRRDEADRRGVLSSSTRFSKRRDAKRYSPRFFFSFFLSLFIGRETSTRPEHRCGGRGDNLSFVHREGLGWANRANREILVSSLHPFFAPSNEPLSPSFILSPFRSFFRPFPSPSASSSSSSSRSTLLHASFSLRSSRSPLSSPPPVTVARLSRPVNLSLITN